MFFTTLLYLLSIILAIFLGFVIKKNNLSKQKIFMAISVNIVIFIVALIISVVLKTGLTLAGIVVLFSNICIYIPSFIHKVYNITSENNQNTNIATNKSYNNITENTSTNTTAKNNLNNNTLRTFISNRTKLICHLSYAIALILICEVFICNFGAFALAYPNAPSQETLLISDAVVDGATYQNNEAIVTSNESLTLCYNSINSEVRTIYADLVMSDGSKTTLDIGYTDESNAASIRNKIHLNYINGDTNSQYVTCSLFGNVDTLNITVNAEQDSTVTLRSITINKTIPFHFSLIRVSIFLLFAFFVIILCDEPLMKTECTKTRLFTICAVFVTIIFLFIALKLFLVRGTDVIKDYLTNPDTNQINQELVDAFEAKQFNLLQEPSDELLALDNPYDYSLRSANQVSAAWDHLLYNGKYYSYYGIGSVLTLFLPYHMITGKYFSSLWATLLYSLLGIIFLTMAYCVFVKKLFSDINTGIATAGLVIIQVSSFIWYCITIGNFYELAQISGFTFLVAGSYFLFKANLLGDGKISRINLAIATTLLSIAVLCRAVLALYCFVALIVIYAGVKKIIHTQKSNMPNNNNNNNNNNKIKNKTDNDRHASRKPVITYLLAALLPFVLIGSIQMYYNYMRFGSIFDFGISYTLTIYDYYHVQFHIPLMLIGLYNYLFTAPKINTTFPFVCANYDSLSVNGYYFLASFSAVGLIYRAFPVLAYIWGPKAYKIAKSNAKNDSKNSVESTSITTKRIVLNKNYTYRINTIILVAGCIIVPFIQMAMIWQYGYGARYAVDFAWEIILGAFVILFILHNKLPDFGKKLIYSGFVISAVISFIVNFALTYEFVLDYANTYHVIPEDMISRMLSFGRLFEFWNMM